MKKTYAIASGLLGMALIVSAAFYHMIMIIAGSLAKEPNHGVIVNNYVRPKTGERQIYSYSIPGMGKIILTSISDNQKTVTFKTESNKTGTFELTNQEGRYTIN